MSKPLWMLTGLSDTAMGLKVILPSSPSKQEAEMILLTDFDKAIRENIEPIPSYGSGATEHRHAEYRAIAKAQLKKVVEMLDGIENPMILTAHRATWHSAIQTIKQAIEGE